MALFSTLFLLLLSFILVFAELIPADRTARWPKNSDQVEGDMIDRKRQQRSLDSSLECQEGNPLGACFSGSMNVTTGGRTCQACQEGDPLGANYQGSVNVTTSGRTCQAWSAQEPHDHDFADLGEHNHCRNPEMILMESGASPPIQIRDGSTVLF